MIKKLILVINPVTLFLMFNIIAPKNLSPYDQFLQLDRVDYVNIGSSHGMNAFNYEDIPNSINLGFGSQRMHYGLKILNTIEDSLDSKSKVIIPVSIFSFCGQYDGPKKRYLGFIPNYELGISKDQEFINKYFPYIGIGNTEDLIGSFKKVNNEFNDNGFERANLNLNLAHDCGVVEKSIIDEIERFIFRNHEKRIIFVIPPYYFTYWEVIDNERKVLDETYKVIYYFTNQYNIEFYDYSTDDRFSNSKELFRDSDHLNTNGSIKFTRIILNDLNQRSNY